MEPTFEEDIVTQEEKMALDQVDYITPLANPGTALRIPHDTRTDPNFFLQDALSRQIAVFDFKGSLRITTASVLISGMGPLGVVTPSNFIINHPLTTLHLDFRKSPKTSALLVSRP